MEQKIEFQGLPDVVLWKLHLSSSPDDVYHALATDDGRQSHWSETAIETDGKINFVFLNDVETTGEILERDPGKRYRLTYFGFDVTFDLTSDGAGGTDLQVTCGGVSDGDKRQMSAGWVSWLLTLKAAVDFGVDLRNHDASRTWFDGFADN